MFNYNEPNKIFNINPAIGLQRIEEIDSIINTGSVEEFIVFAKSYNIFQQSNNKFYKLTCEKIRNRLQQENLTEDDVRPGE
jgi:hypothetical protein